MADEDDNEQVYRDFKDAVNMAPKEIEDWLETDESRAVGQKSGGQGESVGHASGRHIVAILRAKKGDLGDRDYAHMRKVVGYIHRHRVQGPAKRADIENSAWRRSLMNWGHDPMK